MSPPSTGSTPPTQGEVLAGRYALQRRIGKGGMAEVWAALDTELDRQVAVKWLRSSLASDEVVAERFRREALACAKLSHPNIVAVHDVCEHDGRQAVVLQLVDGKSLRTILDSQKRLGPELTIHIGAAIAGALDAAHRAGFVHRDVKPANILVTSDGRVLLTDFGIAKALGTASGDETDDLTSPNVMMGTAKYLAPEQVRGKRLDGRADLYSLALVLYECLAGRVPFLGETDADTALARLQRDPTDLAHLRPTLPIGLVNLIHRTLARNPHHRPQTGAALRSALHAVDATPPDVDRTPADPPPRLANPPQQALGAGPGIPGEPHVSGSIPAVPSDPRPTRDASGSITPVHPEPTTNEDTPPGPSDLRGRPARQHEDDTRRATIVIAGLATIAILVAVALVVATQRGETDPDLPTVPTGNSSPANETDTSDPVAAPTDPVTIDALASYDPEGDNGTENNTQVNLARPDNNPDTFWATECYQNQYLGGKSGVGVVVTLNRAATGTLSFDVGHGPYQVDVYATDADSVPSALDGWESMGETAFADKPQSETADIIIEATHVLVWFSELGPDSACSDANPYRGLLGEVRFEAN